MTNVEEGGDDDGLVNMNVHQHMLLNAFDLRTLEVVANEDKLSGAVTLNMVGNAVLPLRPDNHTCLLQRTDGHLKDHGNVFGLDLLGCFNDTRGQAMERYKQTAGEQKSSFTSAYTDHWY